MGKAKECEEDNFLPVVAMPGVPHALTAKDYSSVPFVKAVRGPGAEYETKGPLKKFNFRNLRNLETYSMAMTAGSAFPYFCFAV